MLISITNTMICVVPRLNILSIITILFVLEFSFNVNSTLIESFFAPTRNVNLRYPAANSKYSTVNRLNNNNNVTSGLRRIQKASSRQLFIRQTGAYPNGSAAINNVQEDAQMTTPEIILKYGYDVETHQIITEDGYILTVFRIPGRLNSLTNNSKENAVENDVRKRKRSTPKKAILLQHCILCSSSVFVLMGPGKSLGFVLADAGYDVWIGNSRGTFYSKRHTYLSNSSKQYWKFSWHEMGVYDVPATIDYMLEKTGNKKVYYVGHSMGNTMIYPLLSIKPEYNNKLSLVVCLSPVAYMSNIKSPIFKLLYGPVSTFMNSANMNEFVPNFAEALITKLGRQMCRENIITADVCSNILFLIAGYNSNQLNKTMLPVIFGHLPAGTSTNSLRHYGQCIENGDFRQFDYGQKRNLQIYKSSNPPQYRLNKITAPMAFFYSDNDWLSDYKDVQRLATRLTNEVHMFKVPNESFNHMDYLFAVDAKKLVYDDMLDILERY